MESLKAVGLSLVLVLISFSLDAQGAEDHSSSSKDHSKPTCPDVIGVSDVSRVPLLAQLPDDLKPHAKEAILQTLRESGAHPDSSLSTSWSPMALRQMKVSGLFTQAEIVQEVQLRINILLESGRRRGLSAVYWPRRLADLNLPAKFTGSKVVGPQGRFEEKYDLSDFVPLVDMMRSFQIPFRGEIGLSTAFRVAHEIGDHRLQLEILQHMLLSRNFEPATRAAELVKSDKALLNIGLFALTDHFRPSTNGANSRNANSLFYAIEALKSVQGALKPQANQILFDLGLEIFSRTYLDEALAPYRARGEQEEEAAVHRNLIQYSLMALRSTGRLIGKVKDGSRFTFITQVTDPAVKAAIQKVLDYAQKQNLVLWPEDEMSRVAIGDVETVIEQGKRELAHARETHNEQLASKTAKKFANAHSEQDFKEAAQVFLELMEEAGPRGLSRFGSFLYSLRERGYSFALEWVRDVLALPKFQSPVGEAFSRKLADFIESGTSDPEEAHYLRELKALLPPESSVSADVYAQLAEEATLYLNLREQGFAGTREQLIQQIEDGLKNGNGSRVGNLILRAALLTRPYLQ